MTAKRTESSPPHARLFTALGVALLGLWAAWWIACIAHDELPFARATWIRSPVFGADFWSQPDYAARIWRAGLDPYENHRHLFHYPPIVIRLFLWTPFFGVRTALYIWVATLAALIAAGALVAARLRPRLGASTVPSIWVVALVLLSYPCVFALERSNFDLITLAALLLSLPLVAYGGKWGEFAAGCLLAVGPWVKIYPGFMGLGLLALKRFRGFFGFVVSGVGIFFIAPAETLRSFECLRIQIGRTKESADYLPYAVWSHSLSIAWVKVVQAVSVPALRAIPGSVVALAVLALPVAWVCRGVFRCNDRAPLFYPTLLWITAAASFVPEIANDYSLVFLPLCAAAVVSAAESRLVSVALLLSLVAYQPFALPIPGLVVLLLKFVGLVAVGASLVARADELSEPSPIYSPTS